MPYQMTLPKALTAASVFVVADSTNPTPANCAQWDATLDASIAQARAERDRLAARWTKGADYLDALAAREGQDSPEFCRLFAEWEKIDAAYKRVSDRIECLEINAEIKRGAR